MDASHTTAGPQTSTPHPVSADNAWVLNSVREVPQQPKQPTGVLQTVTLVVPGSSRTVSFSVDHKGIFGREICSRPDQRRYLPDGETECKASFASTALLYDHRQVYHERKPFLCPACQLSFGNRKNCSRHIQACKVAVASGMVAPTSFKCPRNGCSKSSPRADLLKRHLKTCKAEFQEAQEDAGLLTRTKRRPNNGEESGEDEARTPKRRHKVLTANDTIAANGLNGLPQQQVAATNLLGEDATGMYAQQGYNLFAADNFQQMPGTQEIAIPTANEIPPAWSFNLGNYAYSDTLPTEAPTFTGYDETTSYLENDMPKDLGAANGLFEQNGDYNPAVAAQYETAESNTDLDDAELFIALQTELAMPAPSSHHSTDLDLPGEQALQEDFEAWSATM